MNSIEAALIARDHFYGVPGMLPEIGFEAGVVCSVIVYAVLVLCGVL